MSIFLCLSDSWFQAIFFEGTYFASPNTAWPHVDSYRCVRGRPQSYKDWCQSQLDQACNAVTRDALPIRRDVKLFSVPCSTLHDHISGRVPQGSSSGPPKYLSTEEEEELVHFLQSCADIGFAWTRQQVLLLVQSVVNKKGLNVRVTSGWWDSFRHCQKELALGTAEQLSYVRMP